MCICAGIWNKGVATSCRVIFSFCLAPFFECAKMYKCNCCAWAVLWTILRIFALKYNIAPVCEHIHICPDIYDGTLIFMTFSRWQLECLSKCPPDSDSNSHYVRFTNGYISQRDQRHGLINLLNLVINARQQPQKPAHISLITGH